MKFSLIVGFRKNQEFFTGQINLDDINSLLSKNSKATPMKKFNSMWAIFSTASLVSTTIISYAQSQENVDTQSPGQVAAESDTRQLKEVLVISNTPLEGVGVALEQIPSDVQIIKAKNDNQESSNLGDLLNNNIGSVNIVNSVGNPFQSDVSYRGFQATSLQGAPVGLSVYFDGVRMNEPFGSNVNWDLIPSNAISKIELLPGSNPVFGLNTLGGAISISTKNGKYDEGMSFKSTFGSFDRRAFQFENGWVDDEKGTDYYFAGNIDQQSGYRKYSSSDVRQFFGKVRRQGQGGEANLELSFALADTVMNGTQALPTSMLSSPTSAYTYPDSTSNQMALINLKATKQLTDTSLLIGNVYYRKANTRTTNSNAAYDDGCSTATTTTASDCASAATNGTVANSITGTNPYGFSRYTADINSSLVFGKTKQDTIGSNVQWSDFGKLGTYDNNLTLGAAYDYSKIKFTQETWLAQLVDYQTVINYTNPRYSTALGSGFTNSGLIKNVNLSSTNTDLSLYFTDTLSLNEKLDVIGSASYNFTRVYQDGATNQYLNDDGGYSWADSINKIRYYNSSYIGQYVYKTAAPYYTTVALPTLTGTYANYTRQAGPQTTSLDGEHTYERLNPAVGFSYTPMENKRLNIFGSYSESMRAPTSIELSCADPKNPCSLPTGFNGDPNLNAVVAKTYELGTRGVFGKNSFWNAAIYDTQTSNDIQFIYSSTSGLGYFSNVGNTQRKGYEFGISSQFDSLFLSANYGHVDATFRTAFTTSNGDSVSVGNQMPGIANDNLKLRGAYNFSNSIFGANLLMSGNQFAYGDEANTDSTVPGYTLLNLDLHYKVNDELTIFGIISNALNRKYYTYGLSGGTNIYNGLAEQFLTPGPERNFYIGVIYNFGEKKKSDSKKHDKD